MRELFSAKVVGLAESVVLFLPTPLTPVPQNPYFFSYDKGLELGRSGTTVA